MTEEKRLIDTNVLAYAYDSTDRRHETASKAVEEAMLKETGAVSVQNLAEFSRLVTEKFPKTMPPGQARSIVLELAEGLEVFSYDAQTIAEALHLCSVHGIHFFDALLAATMEKEKIRIIVTENDKDFKKIPWLTVANPFK